MISSFDETDYDYVDLIADVKDFFIRVKDYIIRKLMVILSILAVIVALFVAKWLWTGLNLRQIGSFDAEKTDILERRNYLMTKIMVKPQDVINEMPEAVGDQFLGEWALYSCSMFAKSLANIAELYPETRLEAIASIDSLIAIATSPELRAYDTERWGEDPLESLDGEKSHISYLSHIAWMISNYKAIGGDGRYDDLYDSLCSVINRRMLSSPNMNLQTYPNEPIYVPDMLVAVVALSEYSKQNNGMYSSTVHDWLSIMKNECIDEKTGLIPSIMLPDEIEHNQYPLKGSYSALSCYYLSIVDEEFGKDQYERLKDVFLKKQPFTGIKEHQNRRCLIGMDIDAGPILFSLSPSGTAFAIGPATYHGDMETRNAFLKTAEIAGSSVSSHGRRHYLLANIALVGEAITLAMRTSVPQ